MSDIFISYAREDKVFVEALNETLRERSLETWIDIEGIYVGEEFWPRLCSAIENAKTFGFIISPHSINSKYCNMELDHAIMHNKRILPIIRHEVNEDLLPQSLASRQWIFFREVDNSDIAIENLIVAINTDPEWVHEHTRLLRRAIEWKNQDRKNDFLLQGSDSEKAEQWLSQANEHEDPKPTVLQTEYIITSRQQEEAEKAISLSEIPGREFDSLIAAVRSVGPSLKKRQVPPNLSVEGLIAAVTNMIQSIPFRGKNGHARARARMLASQSATDTATEKPSFTIDKGEWLSRHARMSTREQAKDRILTHSTEEGTAKLWDASTGKLIKTLKGHKYNIVASAILSPDGTRVVTIGSDSKPRLWSARTGKLLTKLEGHKKLVDLVEFSSDSGLIISISSEESTVRFWNPRNGRLISTIDDVLSFYKLIFSPNYKLVIAVPKRDPRLWEVTTGKLISYLQGHTEDVTIASFSQDDFMLTASSDAILIWDLGISPPARTRKLTLKGHTSTIYSAEFSPDRNYVLTVNGDGNARLWKLWGSRLGLATLQGKKAKISPDGTKIITLSEDGVPMLWDSFNFKLLGKLKDHSGRVTSVKFSSDSKKIIAYCEVQTRVTSFGEQIIKSEYTSNLWDANTFEHLSSLPGEAILSPNGTFLVTSKKDDELKLWDARTFKPLFKLKKVERWRRLVEMVIFSPDETLIVTISKEGKPKLWDIPTQELIGELKDHIGETQEVIFSPDGTKIITINNIISYEGEYIKKVKKPGLLQIWDRSKLKLLKTLNEQKRFKSVIFSPDGTRMITLYEEIPKVHVSAILWNVQTLKPINKLNDHKEDIHRVVFSPNGTKMVTTYSDKTAKLRSATNGEPLITLEGHKIVHFKVEFSSDSKNIMTVDGYSVRLWDALTGKLLVIYEDLISPAVEKVLFYPDGSRIIIDKDDYTTEVCPASVEEFFRIACEILQNERESELVQKYCEL